MLYTRTLAAGRRKLLCVHVLAALATFAIAHDSDGNWYSGFDKVERLDAASSLCNASSEFVESSQPSLQNASSEFVVISPPTLRNASIEFVAVSPPTLRNASIEFRQPPAPTNVIQKYEENQSDAIETFAP